MIYCGGFWDTMVNLYSFQKIWCTFFVASAGVFSLHGMVVPQNYLSSAAQVLEHEALLPTAVCHAILSYLPAKWKVQGTCDVGFEYHGPHDFTSRRVVLTDHGVIWSSGCYIAHHDHAGNFREILKTGETDRSVVSYLTSSRTLPDCSAYVAAAVQKRDCKSFMCNNFLKIWLMRPHAIQIQDPVVIRLETEHEEEYARYEIVKSLVFSSDRDVTYLAAAGHKHLTVLRRNYKTGIFTTFLRLNPEHSDRYIPINLSFPEQGTLVSLYGDTMKKWKLVSDIAPILCATVPLLPTVIADCIEEYADDPLLQISHLDSSILAYSNYLMSPTDYLCAEFNYGSIEYESVRLMRVSQKPRRQVHLEHSERTNGYRRYAVAMAYARNGYIVGGFNDGSVVIWDPKAQNKVIETLHAEQAPMKYKGLSSVAVSPDGMTIAAHDFSGLATVFKRTYTPVVDDYMPDESEIAADARGLE